MHSIHMMHCLIYTVYTVEGRDIFNQIVSLETAGCHKQATELLLANILQSRSPGIAQAFLKSLEAAGIFLYNLYKD